MESRPSNEPAFPCEYEEIREDGIKIQRSFGSRGMTLRDYFASKAMSVFMQSTTLDPRGENATEVAKVAYAIADAMLEARTK